MELVAAGTIGAGSTATYGDGSWRSSCWAVTNHTASAGTVLFSDKNGGRAFTVSIPAANASYIYVHGDYQKITASGVVIDYMVFA